jgi:hypothetical protein
MLLDFYCSFRRLRPAQPEIPTKLQGLLHFHDYNFTTTTPN